MNNIFSIFSMTAMVFLLACASAQTETASPETLAIGGLKEASTNTNQNMAVKPNEKKTPAVLLKEIEKKYSNAPSIKANVHKTLKLKMLNQERKAQGTLELKRIGKFRLEFSGAEKTIAISNAKNIWVVTLPTDPEFDNTTRVIRSNDPKKLQSQTLLTFLVGQGSLLANYSIKNNVEKIDEIEYELYAKNKNEELKTVFLTVSKSSKEIKKIQYSDNLENISILELSQTNFNAQVANSRFNYKPPKGAEVTDL